MSGWIKLHRQIFDSDLWSDVVAFRLFTYLLMMAAHQDGIKINGIELKRGQYIRSYRNLAKDLGYVEKRGVKQHSISTIKRNVEKLVKSGRVNAIETDYGTLFTIVNYDKYQGSRDASEDKRNTQNEFYGTSSERQRNAIGTLSEQEQECKNLRMQEDISTTSTTGDGFVEAYNFINYQIVGLNDFQRQDLECWYDDFNQDKEVLMEAGRIAADRNRKNYGFIKGRLKEWADNKCNSIQDVRLYEQNKFSKQTNVRQFAPRNKQAVGGSLYDPSPETLERQRRAVENFNPQQITDDSDLPF